MPPGRPPKPTAQKRLEGNAGKRRLNDAEPQPDRGIPDCPGWLPKAARAFWDAITKTLDAMGIMTTADAYTVAMMADALAEWSAARAYVVEHGAAYDAATENGKIRRANPEVAMASDAMRRFNSLAAQFGLSASTRAKLAVPPKRDAQDPLDELRARREKRAAGSTVAGASK